MTKDIQEVPEGHVVVTWDQDHTRILAVTRQDDDGRILSVIAEVPAPNVQPKGTAAFPEQGSKEATAPAPQLPAGWRLAKVSDGDIRVYGPDKESWLIRKDSGEGFYDFIHRFFDALATQATAVGAWQPIETAPKDEPGFVLLGNADEGWREQAWWDDDRREWWSVNTHWTDAYSAPLHPTHWLRLPAPPEVKPPVQPIEGEKS